MRRLLLLIAIGLSMPWCLAYAQQEGGEGKVRISCDASVSHLHLDDAESPSPATHDSKARVWTVDTTQLVTITPEDEHGNVLKTGSRSVTYRCGRLSIRLSDDYIYPNPLGINGAYDYPVVEIFEGRRRIAGPLAIGAGDDEEGDHLFIHNKIVHPDDWAVEVDVSMKGRQFDVQLKH